MIDQCLKRVLLILFFQKEYTIPDLTFVDEINEDTTHLVLDLASK